MTAAAYTNTPYAIIRSAMEDAGRLQAGDDPTPEDYAKYMQRLSNLLNHLQVQPGLKLWLQSDQAVTLVALHATYNIYPGGDVDMPKPLRVLQAYYLDTANIRKPLLPLSRDEYTRLSQVVQTGPLNSYFVDKQATKLAVSFWLVPDATAALGTAHLIIQRQVTNPIALTEDIEFPVEWALALEWSLADIIATGQPQAIMDRCTARSVAYREALENWDVEDASTMFQPDQRSQYVTGNFR